MVEVRHMLNPCSSAQIRGRVLLSADRALPLQLSLVVDCEYARQKEEDKEASDNKEAFKREGRYQEGRRQEGHRQEERRQEDRYQEDRESYQKGNQKGAPKGKGEP